MRPFSAFIFEELILVSLGLASSSKIQNMKQKNKGCPSGLGSKGSCKVYQSLFTDPP